LMGLRELAATLEIEQVLARIPRNAVVRQFRIGDKFRNRHRFYLSVC